MSFSTIAIDLAKTSFHVCGVDESGEITMNRKMGPGSLRKILVDSEPCVIIMENCGGAHYWGRFSEKNGHRVRLISPQHVKPYVTSGQKNDRNDCFAILEAAKRPNQYFQTPKSEFCQSVQSVLRTREHFVSEKVALTNHIRGLLLESGRTIAKGDFHLKNHLVQIIAEYEEAQLPEAVFMLSQLQRHLLYLEDQIKVFTDKILSFSKEQPVIKKLTQVPGIGPISAAWFYAQFGDGRGFKNGRQASACLGLVPRQHSTGGKSRLRGITKRGSVSVRSSLIHGGRSYVRSVALKGPTDKYSEWVNKLLETKGVNKTSVAVANKNARIMWRMLAKGTEYRN